jgi:hypothetical protein
MGGKRKQEKRMDKLRKTNRLVAKMALQVTDKMYVEGKNKR